MRSSTTNLYCSNRSSEVQLYHCAISDLWSTFVANESFILHEAQFQSPATLLYDTGLCSKFDNELSTALKSHSVEVVL